MGCFPSVQCPRALGGDCHQLLVIKTVVHLRLKQRASASFLRGGSLLTVCLISGTVLVR